MRTAILTICAFVAASVAAALPSPQVQSLLDRADALERANDHAGALEAYVAAVRIDVTAESFDRISQYQPRVVIMPTAAEKAANDKQNRLYATALGQYVERHPSEWEAVELLTLFIDVGDAEKLVGRYLEAHPEDPRAYRRRGGLRYQEGRVADALADYRKAIDLEPSNPEHHYIYGVAAYDAAAKANLPEYITSGLAAIDRAMAMKPDYVEAIVYRSLLLREQAKREKDPEKQKSLTAEADILRAKAKEIIARRKAAVP